MKPTFLQQFIEDHLQSYQEPTREGTPRGEPIGLFRKKFFAALVNLSNHKLKDLAGTIGVSYGLLRKWRTEDVFWDTYDQIAQDFSDKVIAHLKKRADRQVKLRHEYFSLSPEQMIETPPPFISWNEFEDLGTYSNDVILLIMGKLNRLADECWKALNADDDEFLRAADIQFMAICAQIDQFNKIIQAAVSQSQEVAAQEIAQPIGKLIYLTALHILRKSNPTEDDRKLLIFFAHDQAGECRWVTFD